ncbi:MAG TPA: tetratricopeptide repeat protein, partial [Armatimonadota bacterium]|nr:tetratricopeptide repeat protein [Armatimonadota bacterium]
MPELKEAGIAALRRGDPSLALRYLTSARREDPEDAELLNYLGITCGRLNLLDKAVACLREGARLAPKSPELRYNLGLALYETEQWESAAECFERTLELDPFHERARRALGKLAREGAGAKSYLRGALLAGGYQLPHDAPLQHALPLLVQAKQQEAAALVRWEGRVDARAPRYQRFQLGLAGATLFLLGALVGRPVVKALINRPTQADSLYAAQAVPAAPTPDLQDSVRKSVAEVRRIDRRYRQVKRTIDQMAKQPALRRRAQVLVSAYISSVEARKTVLDAATRDETASLPPEVQARLTHAVDSYLDAGKAWESFLTYHPHPFWRK